MPFHAGKCEDCGEYDYLTYEANRWLCRYCLMDIEHQLPEIKLESPCDECPYVVVVSGKHYCEYDRDCPSLEVNRQV